MLSSHVMVHQTYQTLGVLTPNFDYIHKLRKFNEEVHHKAHFQP